MKIKWESNSRAKALADDGKIDSEDIIKHTTTENFPTGMATVRIQNVRQQKPHVVIHIKGNPRWASVCRVTLAGAWGDTMCSNGDLCEELNWLDVHNVVTRVKKALETE